MKKLVSQEVPKDAQKARCSQSDLPNLFALQGEVNSDFVDWLKRSIICTSEEPRDLGALASALASGFGEFTKVCSLSSHKFILTLPSVARMEELICNHEELDQWFVDVKKWDKYDCCASRRVWLEIIGVPPHGWNCENFQKIANVWGRLVSLGKSISRTDSFNSMKVLIDTDILGTIEGDLVLTLEDSGYRVKIKEAGSVIQVCQSPHVTPSAAHSEDANEGVVGFEDLDDEVDGRDKLSVHLDGEVGEEAPQIQKDSNLAQEIDKAANFQIEGSVSSDKTKTAVFSQNACSEEVISRHLFSLEVQKGSIQVPSDDQHARGCGNLTPVPIIDQPLEEEGFHFHQQLEDLPQPPGFERPTQAFISKMQSSNHKPRGCKGNLSSWHLVSTSSKRHPEKYLAKESWPRGVRSTSSEPAGVNPTGSNQRGQELRSNPSKAPNRPDQQRNGSESQCSSGSTEDSLQKIANEALEIGKLLGLTVIQHERFAKGRHTKSLRKCKKSQTQKGVTKSKNKEGAKD